MRGSRGIKRRASTFTSGISSSTVAVILRRGRQNFASEKYIEVRVGAAEEVTVTRVLPTSWRRINRPILLSLALTSVGINRLSGLLNKGARFAQIPVAGHARSVLVVSSLAAELRVVVAADSAGRRL